MRSIIKVMGLTILFSGLYSMVFAQSIGEQHVVWNKTIIDVALPLQQEKMIEVCQAGSDPCQPLSLTPYLPQTLINDGDLQSINNQGTLYLRATKPFANQLVELKTASTKGDVVLLRLHTDESATTDRLLILLPSTTAASAPGVTAPTGSEDRSLGDMIRWVAQQLYAPKRLLTQPNWIVRVPMHSERFVPLYRGAIVSSMPLASWRSGDYYVTALLLRNVIKHHQQVLREDFLRGQWIAASFFRQGRLSPSIVTGAGTLHDSTVVILVSSAPFTQALGQGE